MKSILRRKLWMVRMSQNYELELNIGFLEKNF